MLGRVSRAGLPPPLLSLCPRVESRSQLPSHRAAEMSTRRLALGLVVMPRRANTSQALMMRILG